MLNDYNSLIDANAITYPWFNPESDLARFCSYKTLMVPLVTDVSMLQKNTSVKI